MKYLFIKGSIFEINAGIQNIFNSYQDDFDKGKDRVSSYIYGPAIPRSYFAGAKISFSEFSFRFMLKKQLL